MSISTPSAFTELSTNDDFPLLIKPNLLLIAQLHIRLHIPNKNTRLFLYASMDAVPTL